MKVLAIIALICVTGALSYSVPSKEKLKSQLAQALKAKLGSRGTIIPPQDDPMDLGDKEWVWDSETLQGTGSIQQGVIVGLSTLTDDVQINVLTLRVTAFIDLGTVTLTSGYALDAKHISGETSIAMTGSGALSAAAKNVKTKIALTLFPNLITNKVTIKNLLIDLDFESFEANAEGAALDGLPIDWDLFNVAVKPTFDATWPFYKPVVEKLATEALNEALSQYTLAEIIEMIIGNGKGMGRKD